MIPNFYYHPRQMEYDFGQGHPLKPIRLHRTMELLQALVPDIEFKDAGLGDRQDVLRVHSPEFVEGVQNLSEGMCLEGDKRYEFGFGSGDNPPFLGMYEAALAYCASGVRAAHDINEGARLAFNMAGGLHHARTSQASGFCIFNDPAISCHILRERFDRVMYIDIDLHHGDGVQWIFYEDPTVMTYSIHETGRTLYPGTGFTREHGAENSSINVPLEAGTTGDVWLKAFRQTVIPVFEQFAPGAIVLQMGCDAHRDDPLGHLQISVQEFYAAVATVRDLGVPIVACGGGGYHLANVPRMWAGAVMILAGLDVPEAIPSSIPAEWGMTLMRDEESRVLSGVGEQAAEESVRAVLDLVAGISPQN